MTRVASAVGIAIALAGLFLGAMMEGTPITAFLNLPAIILVLGGTAGATIASQGLDAFRRVPALYRRALSSEPTDFQARIVLLVGLANRARRDGLLALDAQAHTIDDEFTRKGLQLVVDGTDPSIVEEVLVREVEGMSARHTAAARVFDKGGGFAPTMGIIGTVMGLVHVLENLSRPATLGPAISGAFVATLIGVGMANVILLPIGDRLRGLSADEAELRYLTLEGILAIQNGESPRIIAGKLAAFVPPADRPDEDTLLAIPAAGADAAVVREAA
ncbi:MAG TPA: MotA/TolQ/ExbB proton channel family protein [Solirubrobacteraceae bacterium]|nr:MotA/TolQ/ExbB proton channel family protein [Solirubrobacteraceae bacterium]